MSRNAARTLAVAMLVALSFGVSDRAAHALLESREGEYGVGVGGSFEDEESSAGDVELVVDDGGSGGSSSGSSRGGSVTERPQDVVLAAGTLRGLWGGGRCVVLNAGVVPTLEDEAQLLNWIAAFGLCPDSGGSSVAPDDGAGDGGTTLTHAELERTATEVWVEVPLATPQPQIAPGWMLVGKWAFLEPGTSLGPVSSSTDTPVGLLELEADSYYLVDWGDPADPGVRTYHVEGAPWPDGRITHLYQHAGSYDITVEQVWEARWRVAGGDWNPIDLTRQRVGTIDAFEVTELQAVRID